MRKFAVTLMTSLLSCSAAFAFWPEATDSSLEIGVGYRQDRLEWKLLDRCGGDYSDYSGYSYSDNNSGGREQRFKWHNLSIWQIEARGKYVTCDNVYLRANGDYGWITSGKHKIDFGNESLYGAGYDYGFGRHRSAKGHVYDARIAVGYQFKLCDDSFAIAPLVGYSWHGQHVQDKRKHDYSSDSEYYSSYSYDSYSYSYDYSGSSYGRDHHSFHTRWNGPFVGFDFDYRFGCGCEANWELFGTYEFHWATYNAKFKREGFGFYDCDGFKGHQHAKNAWGSIFDIGVRWDFCECWTVALKGEFQWFWADKGHIRSRIDYANNNCIECHSKRPTRHIKWDSAAVMVDLGMVF